MNRRTKIRIRDNKIESIMQSIGDNIIAGVIIANILGDVEHKVLILMLGGIAACAFYGISYYFAITNHQDD